MEKNLELLKLLADETRLLILNRLMCDDSYAEKLACELSLTSATICYHLKKLEAGGLVSSKRSQFCMIYSLNREIFEKPIYELIKIGESVTDPDEKYRREILSNFFRYGKLKQLPAQRKKREIVLREIAKSFDPEKVYSENEVNDIIHTFHEDHCLIRREMIALGIMERENERYRLV